MATYNTEFVNHTYNPWILYIMIIIPSALIVLSLFFFISACKKPYKQKIKLRKVGKTKEKVTKKDDDTQKFNSSDVSGKAAFFEPKTTGTIN